MDFKPLLLSQRPPDDAFVTLSFGPGVLRFLGLRDLNRLNAASLRAEVSELSASNRKMRILDWGNPMRIPRAMYCLGGVFGAQFRFIEDEYFHPSCFLTGIKNLTDACEVFETVVNEFLTDPFPSIAYWAFVEALKIGDLRLREFRESWCPSAWGDDVIFKTYQGLDDYLVLEQYRKHTNGNIVFKRTPFFNDRMSIKERSEKHRVAETDQANLVGASFATYVYLMEDLRNGRIKIGKSTSPRKREKTLQSEEPNVQLRFAIPCEDAIEKELHGEFAMKRVRGEWFQLDKTQVLDLITRLTQIGDSTRVIADYMWVGRLFVHGSTSLVPNRDSVLGTSVKQASSDELLARVYEKRRVKAYEDAVHDLDELISREVRSGELYLMRARVEYSLANFARALFDVNDAIRLQSESAELLSLRGTINFKLRNLESALSDFDQSLNLSPNSAHVLQSRGAVKCNLKDYVGSLRDLNASILLNPSSANAFHIRGVSHSMSGNLAEAIEDYVEAIRLDSGLVEAYVALGIARQKQSDFSGALREFDYATSLDPDHANARVNKAFLLAVVDDPALVDAKLAIDLAEFVLQLQPKNAYALNAMACALAASGDFASAIETELKAGLDKDWLQDRDIDGGAFLGERVAYWEAGTIWRPTLDTRNLNSQD